MREGENPVASPGDWWQLDPCLREDDGYLVWACISADKMATAQAVRAQEAIKKVAPLMVHMPY